MSAPVAPIDAAASAVTMRDVGMCFFSRKEKRNVRILRNVNLDIHRGEILCVVGPSGCGKSTLLAGIGGFRTFTDGVCLIDGKPVGEPDRHRGVVFQDYPILEFLTALENVALGLDLDGYCLIENLLPFTRRKRSHEGIALAREHLQRVGLEEHADKYPHELSGGQKQRVAIAQAVAMKPSVLLMDEPFSGLDPGTREKLQLVVLNIQRELKTTIFFVTHDLEEAAFLGSRVAVLARHAGHEEGATVVHEQTLVDYKDASAKESASFAALIALLRSKFHAA